MSAKKILAYIKKNNIEYVDLRFTDTRGKEHHLTITPEVIHHDFFESGKSFDGSSISAWKNIEDSDMLLIPDEDDFKLDIFRARPTLILKCTVFDPKTKQPYLFCPRATAKRAEQYLAHNQIADTALFGPETEFFIFDQVTFETQINGCQYRVDSSEGIWNSNNPNLNLDANLGYHTPIKGGYFPVPPVDSGADLRAEICAALKQMGIHVELHHHEVATGGQAEIGTQYDTLTKKADQLQLIKYVAHSVAAAHGKSITFMPKPLIGDNGSGLHVHQSLLLNKKNIFSGNQYAGLSNTALYYIGGIIKHGKALNAFTNASVNSYRRLIPGFEAPIYLVYSAQNRSAAIRMPYTNTPKEKRIEIRFPDATMNPYLAFSALLMAGLDGIKNKIHPGDPKEINLYQLPEHKAKHLPAVSNSLENALDHLEQDHAFLLEDDVFTQEQIKRYIQIKMQEVIKARACTHPIEFEMYYDL
ncbi:MAG: type I glutamate--ammonia ligase [Legionella sp.]|nr:type I glutamate--ammonia ligase [Legionella sp.]